MYLHDLLYDLPYDPVSNPCGTRNRVVDPPTPEELALIPEYQLLRNPFGDFQSIGPRPNEPRWYDWFGYLVWNAGDVGSPNGGPPDGVDDIVIHSEDTDYVGNTDDPNNPQVPNCGGQFVYYGVGDTEEALVHPAHVLLQRPANVGLPETTSRIGRMFARIDVWRNSATGQLEPGLLMAETDATWGGKAKAGIVYLIRLPLPAQPPHPWAAAPIANAWGSNGPLTEPLPTELDEQTAEHMFGSTIVVLDYKDDQTLFPGQQFVVSARQADVKIISTGELKIQAGRAYPYVPLQVAPPPPP
jgi:hypothetical protein